MMRHYLVGGWDVRFEIALFNFRPQVLKGK
jgi:hypothetical protein